MSSGAEASADPRIGAERSAQVIIGLDVGTTGVKAVAFGLDSGWRRLALREYPLLQPAADQEVQDPPTVLEAVAIALAGCAAVTGGADVLAVSVSTAMHALIGLDSELAPLTPLITWADSRARQETRWLRGCDVDLHALTGVPIHPMSPLAKLVWFARHEPETLARARWWVGLKELVLAWLTGRVISELSSASGTGLLDISKRAWSEQAISIAGVSAAQLPEIMSSTATLPLCASAAVATGLPVGTPVVLGGGDGPLGNIGTGAITPGLAGMSLGTSGAVRMAVAQPQVDAAGTLFCYAVTDTLWALGSAISNGGAVIRWAERALAPDLRPPPDPSSVRRGRTRGARTARLGAQRSERSHGADDSLLELAAHAPAGCDGLVMLPYLLAERGPLWDPDLPGAYLGLRHDHTRAHLIRAAIEGVCIQMRLILDRLDAVQPVQAVRATGGVFRSLLWREVMAAMVDRPFEVVGEAEGTALGAAALGLFALDRAVSLTDALAQLTGPQAPEPLVVAATSELVATYDNVRAGIPERIRELDRVARAFSPTTEDPSAGTQ
jgi:gluconokinase